MDAGPAKILQIIVSKRKINNLDNDSANKTLISVQQIANSIADNNIVCFLVIAWNHHDFLQLINHKIHKKHANSFWCHVCGRSCILEIGCELLSNASEPSKDATNTRRGFSENIFFLGDLVESCFNPQVESCQTCFRTPTSKDTKNQPHKTRMGVEKADATKNCRH